METMENRQRFKIKVKIIELDDRYVDTSKQFPYFQSIQSRVRFTLNSVLTLDHKPVILVQNDKDLNSLLPFTNPLQIQGEWCRQNFREIHGRFADDGTWTAELDCDKCGLVTFQLVFLPLHGSKIITRFGTCDVIVVMQNKVDIRFLRKMSVFPRCIGHHTKWVNFFKRQMQLGYNSFHFAPLQETGISKSYYSLHDQLQLSSDVFQGTSEEKYSQLKEILAQLKKDKATFFIDIVLNHTSICSQWIKQEPNSVYTIQNTPSLTSAFQVDKVIYQWGKQIKQVMGAVETRMNQQEFSIYKQRLWEKIAGLNLQEYFQVSQLLIKKMQETVPPRKPSQNLFAKDPIDAIEEYISENATGIGSSREGIKVANIQTKWRTLNLAYESDDLIKGIENFNKKWRRKIQNEWVPQIVNNVMGEIRYEYVDNNFRTYNDPYPFVKRYFTQIVTNNGKNLYAINNGWVGGASTFENFVYSKEFYYLRRRVCVWGDLVRIRYGEKVSDAPSSWRHMTKYVKNMAELFDGFRMDNLHGTQLHVARYMINQARQANPDLIVFAELFTDTLKEKAMFVRTIGINSTLKEAKHMLSGDAFFRTFYKIVGEGGPFVGSLCPYFQTDKQVIKYCKRKIPIELVYDLTHDNQSYVQSGDAIRQLPVALLVNLIGTFSGSTKGFDQYYSKKILVTQQNQLYSQDKSCSPVCLKSELRKKRIIYQGKKPVSVFGSWDQWKTADVLQSNLQNTNSWIDLQLPPGKYQYKFYVNNDWLLDPELPTNSNSNHCFQILHEQPITVYSNLQCFRRKIANYADQFKQYRNYYGYNEGDIIILFRQNSFGESICIVTNISKQQQFFKNPITLFGNYVKADVWYQTNYIKQRGIQNDVEIINHSNIQQFFEVIHNQNNAKDTLIGTSLPAGFACLIRCSKPKAVISSIKNAQQILKSPLHIPPLGALDYNLILYGIARQQQSKFGISNYVLPSNQQLVYAGFAGVYKMICQAKRYNILSLPLFDNLRKGNWLMKYYVDRIKRYQNLSELADIIERAFKVISQLPHELIPRYFCQFIFKLWRELEKSLCKSQNMFMRKLQLATTQFITRFDHQKIGFQTTLAAGLPHFAIGWSRQWGRDTFISNELLLIHPNIYRQIIIKFASSLRHGMIPNLLDTGNNPRYNCRDACWWFIRGIKQYAEKTGDYEIFKTKVQMLFLSNDLLEHNKLKVQGKKKIMIIQDIIQQIFQTHANGVSYRQWHAGIQIDSNMLTEGFTINLYADEETGFIVGGNQFNCLTWMDKMGSSSKAGTKGLPSTPRAGAPIQLVGLLKHCLSAYIKLYKEGKYSYQSVLFMKKQVTFQQWADLIQANFDNRFFIPLNSEIEHSSIKNKYVRLRGIYKDVVQSPLINEEYRLRPNALIAMSLAPELFKEDHARCYLRNVQKHLLKQKSIGVGTLASIHQSLYCQYYDNDDDSDIVRLSHGYSYHNGPEWVWLYGFYVVAMIKFESNLYKKENMKALIQNHIKQICSDDWVSLPQMTNVDNGYNHYSCRAQAWSISSLIMALDQIDKMNSSKQ